MGIYFQSKQLFNELPVWSLPKKVFEVVKMLSGKMLIEADETKCMVKSIMLCERFAIARNFQ